MQGIGRVDGARECCREDHQAQLGDWQRGAARVDILIEGTVVSKEIGLRAVFEGVEQPYVRCVVSRLDDPQRHAEARIVGHDDIPQGVGDTIRLEAYRVVTDRNAGVVRFDCRLLS